MWCELILFVQFSCPNPDIGWQPILADPSLDLFLCCGTVIPTSPGLCSISHSDALMFGASPQSPADPPPSLPPTARFAAAFQ